MVKEFVIGSLHVCVCKTREEMGQAAYQLYKDRLAKTMAQRSDKVRAIFAAAHSQNDFLEVLAKDTEIDFQRIEAFHMDEYMGLGANAKQNFGNFLKQAIFSKQNFSKVNYLDPTASNVHAECLRYEAMLKAAPLDIVSLGIGENGHIAFNDPHEAKFDDERWVRETSLDLVCRQQQVNDGEFSSINEVPETALTLTIPALLSCKTVIGIVPNKRKARAVYDTLYGPVSEHCPASILRTHADATLFLDEAAACLL
jgi:glucosamine-6-phosphate deaminase